MHKKIALSILVGRDRTRDRLRVFLILAFLLAPVVLWAEGEGPESIVFQTNLGSVVFPHYQHGGYAKGDCAVCHHVKEEKRQACRACHKRKTETVEGDPLSFYDVKMGLCRDCHREKRAVDETSEAPVLCKECHNVEEIRYSQ